MKRCMLAVISVSLVAAMAQGQQTRLENLHEKTILVFTPHPDDDVFGAGGTIALLNRNNNTVHIVIYTNDDKGSYDPDMTSQHLAGIRKAEEEVSEGLPTRGGLFLLEIAKGDRPARLHQRRVQVDAAGRAIAQHPAIAIALPALAGHRLPANQLHQRLPRQLAAGIVGAVLVAGLHVFGRVDATQADALGAQRDRVAVIDDGSAAFLLGRHPVEPRRHQCQQTKQNHGQRVIEQLAPRAARTRLKMPPSRPLRPCSTHMANSLLMISP